MISAEYGAIVPLLRGAASSVDRFEFGAESRESSAVFAVPHAATQLDDKAPR
jgi:hypothetical protein